MASLYKEIIPGLGSRESNSGHAGGDRCRRMGPGIELTL